MKHSIVLLVSSVLCQWIPSLTIHTVASASPNLVALLRNITEILDGRMQEVAEWTERIKETSQRHHVLRQAINKMNDESRISSFELNNVPIYAIDDFDRDVVLSQFASAIGMRYNDRDIVEVKYFVKKHGRSIDSQRQVLNYIIKVKTLAQKEQWFECFLNYVRAHGYSEVFDFPGVNKVYDNDFVDPKKIEFYQKRYSLVNVTMRDHLSPFKMALMAVVRGKIKPYRHQFRVKINRTMLYIDRLMPRGATIRQVIEDFSDLYGFDRL